MFLYQLQLFSFFLSVVFLFVTIGNTNSGQSMDSKYLFELNLFISWITFFACFFSDTLFQLKFTGKQLDRLSRKAEKEHGTQKLKVRKALEQQNVEAARIYAENAIRKRQESLNYMRMSSRLDAVQSRVQSAMTMKGVAKDIGVLTKGLEKAMNAMNLEEVEKVMGKFEQQFENLEVMTGTVENAMTSGTALSAPTSEVDSLMKQIAEENGLEVAAQMAAVPQAQPTAAAASAESARERELNDRLQALRG